MGSWEGNWEEGMGSFQSYIYTSVLVVNNITHLKCNVNKPIEKVHGGGSYTCKDCGSVTQLMYNV